MATGCFPTKPTGGNWLTRKIMAFIWKRIESPIKWMIHRQLKEYHKKFK